MAYFIRRKKLSGKLEDSGKTKKPPLKKEDKVLWDLATRDVIKTSSDNNAKEESSPKIEKQNKKLVKQIEKPSSATLSVKAKDLDRSTEDNLRKGKMPIDARLDLHGYTQDLAIKALIKFIQASLEKRHRCVLVITGKGSLGRLSDNLQADQDARPGILRQRVPEWLSSHPSIAPHVLRSVTAQPKDGGAGALYVYLRRQRTTVRD